MKSVDQNNLPTHNVYTVTGEGDTATWNKVGAAWSHKDNKGMTQSISLLGLQTKLVIREAKDNKEGA